MRTVSVQLRQAQQLSQQQTLPSKLTRKNLTDEVNALKDENADLKNKLNNVKPGLENVGPAAFFFEIGKTQLSKKELEHLDFYLTNVLPYVNGKKVTVLTGRADSKTGSARRNKYLCEKRVEYLKNILVEKYGIDASNFSVKTEVWLTVMQLSAGQR